MEETIEKMLPSVAEYYEGKEILITGATGFIGKVLIEKLLRSCPGVKKIYLLMRPKRSQDVEARVQEIVKSPLFDKLRKTDPQFHDKLHPIHADFTENDLGIKQKNVELLKENVQIVFHCAATIRFDEPLRVAVEMNVLSVRKIVRLCKKFQHLEVFLHVSTAYSNCDRPFIEEIVYASPVEPQKLIDALEWLDDEMVEDITPRLIGDKPNTYTYTKHLAESLLISEGSDLPLTIFRPSIVGASWREPFPGWIDNYNGPSGLYIAAGKGILRSMKGEFHAVADIVPVDLAVNMMLTMAWHRGIAQPSSVPIYHCTTGSVNPFTWGEMESIVMNFYKRIPLDACFRRPNCTLNSNSHLHDFYLFVSHMIPAYLVDFGYFLIGQKPRMVNTYNKLHKAVGTMTFFTSKSWDWTYNNLDMLKSQLSTEDRKTFNFDPRGLHWPTYIEGYCLGTKKYVLNEDLSSLPAARAHLRKLRNIRYTFNAVLAVILWRVLIARSQIARNLWYLIMGLVMRFVKFFRITSTIRR